MDNKWIVEIEVNRRNEEYHRAMVKVWERKDKRLSQKHETLANAFQDLHRYINNRATG